MIVRDFVTGLRASQADPVIAGRGTGRTALHGSIPMIGSRGMERRATYRMIYLTNPWAYAAVNKISRDLARLPLHVFELGPDGGRSRVRGDLPATPGRPLAGQILDRLLSQPDSRMSGYAAKYGTMVDRLVYGNAIWEIMRDQFGAPSDFRRQRWRDVRWVRENQDGIVYYDLGPTWDLSLTATPETETRRLVADDVVHFGRGTDSESFVGVSPMEACKYTIALYEGVVRHLVSYFSNYAQPSANIKIENLTEDTAALIRELVVDAYSSPENAGKVLVTSGDWQSMTDTPEHSRVVELLRLSREEMAAVYLVPPPVLGILEYAIKSNVKELREQYVREGLGPWVNEFEDELRSQVFTLQPTWRFLFPEFQLAEQLRPDLEARAQVYAQMKSVLTPDEIRAYENLPPFGLHGITDVPWVDSGAMPLPAAASAAGAPRVAPPVPQDGTEDSAVEEFRQLMQTSAARQAFVEIKRRIKEQR